MNKLFKQEEIKKKLGMTVERLYFALLTVILAIIVLFNITSSLGSLPSFCGLCHGPAHKAWNNSGHAGVSCNACHGGSDFFTLVSGRITLAKMVPAYLTGYYRKPVSTTVSNHKCLSCHSRTGTQTTQSNGLRVSHKEIISAGYNCGDCHSTVVHGEAAVRQNFAELGKCLSCHNNATASGKCETCHVSGEESERLSRVNGAWQISHGKNWRKTHGMGNINICQVCHSKLYCSRCHEIELPHPMAWLTTHGKEVKNSEAAANSCNQCHKGALCEGCHTMQMPHPNDFLEKHSNIIKRDGEDACYSCHLKEGCTRCHKYHTHRGVPQDKLKLLRKEAGLD